MKKVILVLLFLTMLSGCSNNIFTPKVTAPPDPTPYTSPISPIIDQNSADPLRMEVTFLGRIDPTSIEVQKEDGTITALRLSQNIQQIFNDLNIRENDKITIGLDNDHGTLVVRQIVK